MHLLKISLLTILSLSVFVSSDLAHGWEIEQLPLKHPCVSPKPKILKQIKEEIAAFIEEKGLPRDEGNKFSDLDIQGLRFDNQGPSTPYPGHHVYQVQYGTGAKKQGGCFAIAVIQERAPKEESIKVMEEALDDPDHQHRLHNE